jgi:hypothetical protein
VSRNDPIAGHHDLGGQPGGPIDRAEHDPAFWEKQIDALLVSLGPSGRGLIEIDELRRGIEQLPPEAYRALGYYERWISSIARVLVEKGILTQAEIDARSAAIEARQGAKPA